MFLNILMWLHSLVTTMRPLRKIRLESTLPSSIPHAVVENSEAGLESCLKNGGKCSHYRLCESAKVLP